MLAFAFVASASVAIHSQFTTESLLEQAVAKPLSPQGTALRLSIVSLLRHVISRT
jgi:hypothetical protein